MNAVFLFMVVVAFGFSGWYQLFGTHQQGAEAPMQALSTAMIEAAAGAVELAIGLVGVMTLFLGLMKVAEAGGMLTILARLIRMGIRAIQELDKLNPSPGTATNAMALFLAINTSSVTLLPTGVIAIRAAAGSIDPSAILPTTLFATLCSTSAAIIAAKLYSRLSQKVVPTAGVMADTGSATTESGQKEPGYPLWVSVTALVALAAMVPLAVVYGRVVSAWIIPGLMVFFLCFGALRKVCIYEVLVEGAKEGFQVALRIIPYLVAILVAVAMLRASGALDAFIGLIGPLTIKLGLPAEALPMALMRPLSGSGAYGIMAAILNDPAIGPDSYVGYLVSTLQGSTETTFYVLAVYFGAVGIRRTRHALAAALTADAVGIIAAVVACSFLFR
jgi:spore maturation protein SpmB